VRIQLNWFNEKLAARLADLAAGRATAAPPRDAATIMVLRTPADGAGVEILMLRRTAAMRFAPGAYVFPGGSVDPADYGADIGWQGPSAGEFGVRLGASAEVARALVCAAVRETFEESGVLLAGAPRRPVRRGRPTGWPWPRAR
jgi:8-oxo-dGTP pyrophosphatase MutT (NUDIX family)